MAQTGLKKFLNRRKWNTDLSTSYSAPTIPDTYLSGTSSFSFEAFLEKDALIRVFLDPNGSTSLTASFQTNYVYTGAPQTYTFNVSGLSASHYNFRIAIDTSTASYEHNADYVGGSFEPNTQTTGQGPYFEPVLDLASCAITSVSVLSSPTLTTSSSPSAISISWTQTNFATGYNLEKSTNGTTWNVLLSGDPNRFNYLDTDFTPSITYYYRVKAVGNNSNYIDSAFTQSTTTPTSKQLSAPIPSIANVTNNTVQLAWSDISNESYYEINRSFTFSSGYVLAGTVSSGTTTFTDAGLISNNTYFYRIKSKGDGTVYLDSAENSISTKTLA